MNAMEIFHKYYQYLTSEALEDDDGLYHIVLHVKKNEISQEDQKELHKLGYYWQEEFNAWGKHL